MAEVLRFQPNLPVQVALAFATGKRKQPRQPFWICRFQMARGVLPQWRVWLPGERPNLMPASAPAPLPREPWEAPDGR
jgi:hypothetical protein